MSARGWMGRASGDVIASSQIRRGSPVFSFKASAPTEFYTLSLHDALPISAPGDRAPARAQLLGYGDRRPRASRSEEHTSELQSRFDLVCRLLLEKKKTMVEQPTDQPHSRTDL